MSWFGSGVPQIGLPVWYDVCDFAIHVEYLSIRLWASKATAPHIAADFLRPSVIVVAGSGKEGQRRRVWAKETSQVRQKAKIQGSQVLLHRSIHVLRTLGSSYG